MDREALRALLEDLRAGRVDVDAAVARLRALPFEDLGFAKIDHHRALRGGAPEAVFCLGKTPAQVVAILERLIVHHPNILATRADRAVDRGDLHVGTRIDRWVVEERAAPLRRRLLLASLVQRWGAGREHAMPFAQAMTHAGELARFLDETVTQRCDMSKLGRLAPDAHAAHWREVLGFLAIVVDPT